MDEHQSQDDSYDSPRKAIEKLFERVNKHEEELRDIRTRIDSLSETIEKRRETLPRDNY